MFTHTCTVRLLRSMGTDATIVQAARVSHEGKRPLSEDSALIRYLMKNKHTSPFEHVVFTFEIECPLFIRSQIHRHRTFSYNEISRRYTEKNIEIYLPAEVHEQSTKNKQASAGVHPRSQPLIEKMQAQALSALALYNELIDDGVAREEARAVLPVSTMTKFVMTGNLHNFFHFCALRNHPHAQAESRQVAQSIEADIERIVPIAYSAWKETRTE